MFTCQLEAMYEAQGVFFHSDISSDLMLVPHILFINLTGENKSALPYAQRIDPFRNQDGRTRKGR